MTITINNKTLELVEVPEDGFSYDYYFVGTDWWLYGNWGQLDINLIKLPHGSYTLLFKASEATEEDAREIAESMIYLGYRDYSYKKEIDSEDFELCFKYNFSTATESLHSLIRSLGMEPKKTLILKKEK